MNTITLVGRVTKDAELRTTTTGKVFAPFCLAVERRANKTTDFIDCVAWGKPAETIAQHIHKGDRLGVNGSLQTRDYEKDGVKRKICEVLVDGFEFLGANQSTAQAPDAQPTASETPASEAQASGEPPVLPFEI